MTASYYSNRLNSWRQMKTLNDSLPSFQQNKMSIIYPTQFKRKEQRKTNNRVPSDLQSVEEQCKSTPGQCADACHVVSASSAYAVFYSLSFKLFHTSNICCYHRPKLLLLLSLPVLVQWHKTDKNIWKGKNTIENAQIWWEGKWIYKQQKGRRMKSDVEIRRNINVEQEMSELWTYELYIYRWGLITTTTQMFCSKIQDEDRFFAA